MGGGGVGGVGEGSQRWVIPFNRTVRSASQDQDKPRQPKRCLTMLV